VKGLALGASLGTLVGFALAAGLIQPVQPVATHREPYGGCKEAIDYPGTQGSRECGWKRMPHSQKRVGHRACWWLVGDTTYVSCPDGFQTTS